MDFFEEQALAKKRTRRLVVLWLLAVLGVIGAIYGVVAAFMSMARPAGWGAQVVTGRYGGLPESLSFGWFDLELFLITALATTTVIGLGSLYKIARLRGGGDTVARSLGGRLVDRATTDTHERRLLNVVEEMAIASGVPVPDVYVLDKEDSINAFAAGLTPSDAAIGVTSGTVKLLKRDELQGVIAHEFSHILHGDMRLNLRAIGLLHGIFMLTLLGRILIRSGHVRSSRDGGNALPIIGIAFLIIGSVGVLFGRMIQGAISRQREVLADASAVQFTRDPLGLSGALKKIGAGSVGSLIHRPEADEASHMFFSNAVRRWFSGGLLRTHPPIRERILKLDPGWDGEFDEVTAPAIGSGLAGVHATDDTETMSAFAESPGPAKDAFTSHDEVHEAMLHIGQPTPEEVALAHSVHASFPAHWHKATRRSADAQALVFGLLLAQDDALRSGEVTKLQEMTDASTARVAVKFHQEFVGTSSRDKLALVDLAIPTLRRLSLREFERFNSVAEALIAGDRRVALFEYTLQRIVERHLRRYFEHRPPTPVRHRSLRQLVDASEVLLSTLARVGHKTESEATVSYAAAADSLGMRATGGLLAPQQCTLAAVNRALNQYDAASPSLKRGLMFACAASVVHDAQVTDEEVELIRAIGDAIDCPVPPFVVSTM